MSLREILYGVPILDSLGITDISITDIAFDSRKIKHLDMFVAVPGTQVDGHAYISQAIAQGAVCVVCEHLPQERPREVTFIQVSNSQRALAIIAHNYYECPSERLALMGVTGTNGKTTVATLLYKLFSKMGFPCGLLSTVQVLVNEESFEATHTTPDPLQINSYLRQMVQSGCRYAFMEVSSHALQQCRTDGLRFSGAIFTNLSRDHLDYHKTFENYRSAKKKLFDNLPKTAFALVNSDDKQSAHMVVHTAARVQDYGLKAAADYKAKILEQQLNGMLITINGQEIWTPLIGEFNASNLAAVYATAQLLEQDALPVATALSALKAVEGRFQQIQGTQGVTAIVDYAHTPDALQNVLQTIDKLRTRAETLITVVGCGGNRDTGKRPLMAELATRFSDKTILTSDNPRHENPGQIIADMEKGIEMQNQHKYLNIENRREAIKTAIMLAQAGDIVLIAGKGHEKYQEIKGIKYPFDDRALAEEILIQNQES